MLFLAAATGIGMAAAVLDNVRDVKQWYRQTVRGDFFIRAMMPNLSQGEAAALPPELGQEIRAVPGINKNNIDRGRMVKAQVEVERNGEVQDQSVVVIVRDFTRDDAGYFDLEQGDPQAIVDKLFAGEVVVGSVLAQRAGLKEGDILKMDTLEGQERLRIAGVTNEYLFGGLIIFMERFRWPSSSWAWAIRPTSILSRSRPNAGPRSRRPCSRSATSMARSSILSPTFAASSTA